MDSGTWTMENSLLTKNKIKLLKRTNRIDNLSNPDCDTPKFIEVRYECLRYLSKQPNYTTDGAHKLQENIVI
ncbi:hypothetical protein KPH14_009782 [Odynerus spinipes]|uniref:Uncharacterized protein n=1 Tax=Odynerus spinipes TaxID=1348599 RepID=A0AAD9RW30_9HYME|nr:hypothetical protein KPH14_009782 [Odynerus spinipes]